MIKPTLTKKSVETILSDIQCPISGWKGGIEETVERITKEKVPSRVGSMERYRVYLSRRHGNLVISTMNQWRSFHEGRGRTGMFKVMLDDLDKVRLTSILTNKKGGHK